MTTRVNPLGSGTNDLQFFVQTSAQTDSPSHPTTSEAALGFMARSPGKRELKLRRRQVRAWESLRGDQNWENCEIRLRLAGVDMTSFSDIDPSTPNYFPHNQTCHMPASRTREPGIRPKSYYHRSPQTCAANQEPRRGPEARRMPR